MTDTPEPPTAEEPATVTDHSFAGSAAAAHQTVWSRLNKTNRITALVLGAVGAMLAAALIFAIGVWVGIENGGSEEHHCESDTSEYDDGYHEIPDSYPGADEREHYERGGDEQNQDQPNPDDRDTPRASAAVPRTAPAPRP